MHRDFLDAMSSKPGIRFAQQCCKTRSVASCCALLILTSLGQAGVPAPETGSTTIVQDEKNCGALAGMDLQGLPGGPAIIISAQIIDVSAGGLERFSQSGYALS